MRRLYENICKYDRVRGCSRVSFVVTEILDFVSCTALKELNLSVVSYNSFFRCSGERYNPIWRSCYKRIYILYPLN
jgi:hypothetical protein